MNFEAEKILGTLEIITEQYLNFHLPNNETSSLEPFVWDVTQKGDFSLLNLGHDQGWITLTDIDVAVKSWQALERRGYLNPNDDPGDYEDEDIISSELADERAKIYQTLADTIQKNI